MANPRVSIDFSRYSADGLTTFSEHVAVCMDGNVNFKDLNPPVAGLRSCIDVFSVSNANTSDNTREGTVTKNKARAKLEVFLKILGLWVQSNSNNDAAIMLSSGFNLQKEKTAIGALPMPQNLRATSTPGISGSVKLVVAIVPKANGYLWKYTEFPATETSIWETKTTTAANIPLTLKSRTEYVFCVAAIGSDPTETYSDKLTFFVV